MQELVTINDQDNNIDNIQSWERCYKMAEALANSNIVPVSYRNNAANVFIAIQTALKLKIDIMSVMQNSYIVNGKMGMTSAFAISLANSSGLLMDGIRYKTVHLDDDIKAMTTIFEGNEKKQKEISLLNIQVTAYATFKSDGQEISYTIGMKEAVDEGWATKSGSKYKSLPELMLMYRAAMFLIRTHLPQVLLCSHSVEELQDVETNQIKDISKNSTKENKIIKLKDKVNLLVNKTSEESIVNVIELSPLQVLENLINDYKIETEEVNKWLNKAEAQTLEELTEDQIMKSINYITTRKKCA